MARVAQVVVPVTEELVRGIVGPDRAEASLEAVALEVPHPASTPAPRPTAPTAATIRRAALARPDIRVGILTSGGRC
jgi:hypothetical protein